MELQMIQNPKEVSEALSMIVYIGNTNIHLLDIYGLHIPTDYMKQVLSYYVNSLFVTNSLFSNFTDDFQFKVMSLSSYNNSLSLPHYYLTKPLYEHVFISRVFVGTPYNVYHVINAILTEGLHSTNMFLYILFLLFLFLFLAYNSVNILFFWLIFTLYSKSQITKNFLIIMSMFYMTGDTEGMFISVDAKNTIMLLLATVGNFFYGGLNVLFDYLQFKSQVLSEPIASNIYINKLIEGLVYWFSIMFGVFASNGFYFSTSEVEYRALWFIISSAVTIFSSTSWNNLRVLMIKGDKSEISSDLWSWSGLRSISETISFTAVSWSTYYTWGILQELNIDNINIIAAILGFILHAIFSYFVIKMEYRASGNIIYGVLYLMSFTGIAISTNGLFGIMTSYLTHTWSYILALLLCSILTVILYPTIYRIGLAPGLAPGLFVLLKHVILYYLLVFNFVSASGLLFFWLG